MHASETSQSNFDKKLKNQAEEYLGVMSKKHEVLRDKHVPLACDPLLPPSKRTLLWKPPDGFQKNLEYFELLSGSVAIMEVIQLPIFA